MECEEENTFLADIPNQIERKTCDSKVMFINMNFLSYMLFIYVSVSVL